MTGRRPHRPADIVRAQTLRAGDWSYAEIQRLLARDGVIVHVNTVRYWCDDNVRINQARTDLAKKRRDRAAASGGKFRSNARSIEFRVTRAAALADAGLSCHAISIVMNFDGLGEGVTTYEVRECLRTGRPPRRWQTKAAA